AGTPALPALLSLFAVFGHNDKMTALLQSAKVLLITIKPIRAIHSKADPSDDLSSKLQHARLSLWRAMPMKMTNLASGETWMDANELDLNRQLVRGVEKLLKERGVVENPLLVLRVDDIVVSWLLTRRLEAGLGPGEDGER